MNSTNFDVEYVAELARIKLTPEEIRTFQSQLGHVLEHVAKLNADRRLSGGADGPQLPDL